MTIAALEILFRRVAKKILITTYYLLPYYIVNRSMCTFEPTHDVICFWPDSNPGKLLFRPWCSTWPGIFGLSIDLGLVSLVLITSPIFSNKKKVSSSKTGRVMHRHCKMYIGVSLKVGVGCALVSSTRHDSTR